MELAIINYAIEQQAENEANKYNSIVNVSIFRNVLVDCFIALWLISEVS